MVKCGHPADVLGESELPDDRRECFIGVGEDGRLWEHEKQAGDFN